MDLIKWQLIEPLVISDQSALHSVQLPWMASHEGLFLTETKGHSGMAYVQASDVKQSIKKIWFSDRLKQYMMIRCAQS